MKRFFQFKNIMKSSDADIIEDCAQSLGSVQLKSSSGSFGEISCFSLSKNLYSIGGGIIAFDDDKLCIKIK